MSELTIYISSPLSYSDVFSAWYACFLKFWPSCKYDVVLGTNSDDKTYDGIIVKSSNNLNDGWVDRSIPILKSIKSKYVLLMCDDIFLTKTVKESEIDELVQFMDQNDINFCRLNPKNKGKRINKRISYLSKKMPYAINLQVGIFNREYLLHELSDGLENAWEIENRWNRQALEAPKSYFDNVIGVNKYVLSYIHGVYKGKWFRKPYAFLKKHNLVSDNSRGFLTKKEEARIKLADFLGRFFSPKIRLILKKMLRKIGFSFSTDN